MTGFIPVPPEPWVPTATDSETKLFPAETMTALDEHNDERYATTEQGEKADSAYQLPEDGVPATDLTEAVRTSLDKADGAAQKDQNLNDVVDKAAARTNLDVFSKAEANAAFVQFRDKDTGAPIVVPDGFRLVGMYIDLDMSAFPDVEVFDLVPLFEPV